MNKERRFPWEPKIEDLYQRKTFQTKQDINEKVVQEQFRPSGAKGVFRSDNDYFLGPVTPTYKNISNQSIDEIIYEFEDIGCEYITHGEWQKGKMLYCQLTSSDTSDMVVGTDKEIEDYNDDYARQPDMVKNTILIATGHAGKLPFTVRNTAIRVVCWNTFVMALSGDAAISIRHKGDAQNRVLAYKDQVNALGAAHRDLMLNFNRMKRAELSAGDIDQFAHDILKINKNVPIDSLHGKTVKRIDSMLEQHDDKAGNNAWGAFNMVTGYVDHFLNAKSSTEKGAYDFGYKQLLNAPLKLQAYNKLMAYTEQMEAYSEDI